MQKNGADMKHLVIKALVCTLGLSTLIVQGDAGDVFGSAILGAGIGSLADRRNPGRGAAIGASVGATVGIANSASRDRSLRRERYRRDTERNDRAYYSKLKKERRTLERSLTSVEAEIAAIERGDVTATQDQLARLRKKHKQLIRQLDEIKDEINEYENN
jgi:gas vesicle protein